jgi:hypothetical protein
MNASLQQPSQSSSPPPSSSSSQSPPVPPFHTSASLQNSNQSISMSGSQTVNIAYTQNNESITE